MWLSSERVLAKDQEISFQIIGLAPNAMGDMPLTFRYRTGSHEFSVFYEVWRGHPGATYTYRYVEGTTGVWRPHAALGLGMYQVHPSGLLNVGMNFQFGSFALRFDNTVFFPYMLTFRYFLLHGGFSWSF